MIKLWSELPGARSKEVIADVATVVWVLFWGPICLQIYRILAVGAGSGRVLHGGGETMIDSGQVLSDQLAGIPLMGVQLGETARNLFADVGRPLSVAGTQLEVFFLLVAASFALLFALVTIAPWLFRYVPWRWGRLQRVRAAHRAIRKAPDVGDSTIEQTLALRAVTRLEYSDLLKYTPDPLGDWASGRHDRLAKAELASVGLRP